MQQVFRMYPRIECLKPMCLEELKGTIEVHLKPKAGVPEELPVGTVRSESKGVDLWI